MGSRIHPSDLFLFALALLPLAGCSNAPAGSGPIQNIQTYTVGGTVSGLSGTGLVLQDNDSDTLAVSASGSFAFRTPIQTGGNYSVTVLTQPSNPAQSCAVSNASGSMTASNVTNVLVTCTTSSPPPATYFIGGAVSGLSGSGLVLQDNGGDNLTVSADGPFVFATALASGSSFLVTVLTAPSNPAQACAVSNSFGYVTASAVTNVQVTCTPPNSSPDAQFYTVGGTITGLTGSGLVLQDNSGDNLAVNTNGAFAFATPLGAGSTFLVTVFTQPSNPAQSCAVTNASGAVITSDATNVQVTCTALPLSPSSILTAQNEWTWASGSSVVDQAGVYGQLGAPAVANSPGARVGAAGWTDLQGNLWLFGGSGPPVGGGCRLLDPLCWGPASQYFNDLWKFDGSEWTWMGGSDSPNQTGVYGTLGQASAANIPGARWGALSWSDKQGNFWLYGGQGADSTGNMGDLNDLWEYSGGQWTWMGGSQLIRQPGVYGTKGAPAPGNVPGARDGAVAFADPSGNIWLFGGEGWDSEGDFGFLNDLWELSGGQWAWVSGSSVGTAMQNGTPGVYGTLGTPAPGNVPGPRYDATGWMDPSGRLWIFGGLGLNAQGALGGELNDLMRFSGGEWTWMSGFDNLIGQPGTYGTQGVPAPGNSPGSRDSSESWTDANGNLWLFSGEGVTGTPGLGAAFNDLWEYSAGEWAWVGGYNSGIQTGTYGTLGVPTPGNIPGARIGAVTWTDAKGNLWLFGGLLAPVSVSEGYQGYLNDLWVYQPQ